MAWVLAAIGCFVVIHTVVNIAYRKPGPAHEPVAEARERHRKFVQADMQGWTRYAARLHPAPSPMTSARAQVPSEPAPEHLITVLPFDLVGLFTTDPRLHSAPAAVFAPVNHASGEAWRVHLDFNAASRSSGFGEPLAFAKDRHLYLFLQDASRTVLDEPPLPFHPTLELALPPGVLGSGAWTASLYGADAVFSWKFEVLPEPTTEDAINRQAD